MSHDQPKLGAHPDPPLFSRFARWTERHVGSPITFCLAVAIVLLWAVSGPFFGWSDTWQLVINTGTTIVTFLMVFLIQSTQTRDTQALHLKLDELIRVNRSARNSLLNLEEMSESELEEVKQTFERLVVRGEPAADRLDTGDNELTAPQRL
jgi:low affinity Fe/Cu permease